MILRAPVLLMRLTQAPLQPNRENFRVVLEERHARRAATRSSG